MAWAVGLSVDDQWPNGASGPRESAAARRFDDASNARRRCFTIRRKDSWDPGADTDIHLSATLLDRRAGNGWARLLRCGRDRSGGGFPNAG